MRELHPRWALAVPLGVLAWPVCAEDLWERLGPDRLGATRAEIAARGDNLDITCLKDTSTEAEDGLDTPEDIAGAIEGHLKLALEEIAALMGELERESTGRGAEIAEAAE